ETRVLSQDLHAHNPSSNPRSLYPREWRPGRSRDLGRDGNELICTLFFGPEGRNQIYFGLEGRRNKFWTRREEPTNICR
ncbi:hypothetical protein JRQ81_012257, partial [Phrynocephalus forsythii]